MVTNWITSSPYLKTYTTPEVYILQLTTGKQWVLQGLLLAEGTLLTPTHSPHTDTHTHTDTHNTHTYNVTPQFPMKQCQVAKYTYPHLQCPLVMAVKGSLSWRSWVMPKDCWEGGVLRETQCRER